DNRGIGHPRLGLFRLETLPVQDAVAKLQRVARPHLGEPLLETLLVEELADAFLGGHVEMVVALRTDVESSLRFLAENGVLPLRTANPQPFRHAALRHATSNRCHQFRPLLSHRLPGAAGFGSRSPRGLKPAATRKRCAGACSISSGYCECVKPFCWP